MIYDFIQSISKISVALSSLIKVVQFEDAVSVKDGRRRLKKAIVTCREPLTNCRRSFTLDSHSLLTKNVEIFGINIFYFRWAQQLPIKAFQAQSWIGIA